MGMDVINNIINSSGLITEDLLKIQYYLKKLKDITANPSVNNWHYIKQLSDDIENHAYHISSIARDCINKEEALESAHADNS